MKAVFSADRSVIFMGKVENKHYFIRRCFLDYPIAKISKRLCENKDSGIFP